MASALKLAMDPVAANFRRLLVFASKDNRRGDCEGCEMTGARTCPDCSAEIPVEDGLREWCQRCNWNLGGERAPPEEGFLARQYIRIGERYGSTTLARLKATPAGDLRPDWTLSKAIAFAIAA